MAIKEIKQAISNNSRFSKIENLFLADTLANDSKILSLAQEVQLVTKHSDMSYKEAVYLVLTNFIEKSKIAGMYQRYTAWLLVGTQIEEFRKST